MGDELHQHHQRLLHIESTQTRDPALVPDPVSPIAPALWSDVNELKQEVERNGRFAHSKISELYMHQRRQQLRHEESEEKLKAVQKKWKICAKKMRNQQHPHPPMA